MKNIIYIVATFNAGMALGSSLIYYGFDRAQAALPSIAIAVGTTALVVATIYVIVKLNRDFPKWGSEHDQR